MIQIKPTTVESIPLMSIPIDATGWCDYNTMRVPFVRNINAVTIFLPNGKTHSWVQNNDMKNVTLNNIKYCSFAMEEI